MPVIEMNEDILANLDCGRLTPKANQKQYVSTWAIKEGEGKDLPGFPNQRDLSGPQPFGNGSGRALSGWEPHKIAIESKGVNKGTTEHLATLNGVRVVEMICDRESVELRDRWNGTVSKNNIQRMRESELERQDRMGLPRQADNMVERAVIDPDAELESQTK